MGFKHRDYSHLPKGTGYILRYIDNKIHRNQNFIGVIIGQTGTGKSYTALSLLEQRHPGKDVSPNVCLKARRFMELLNDEKQLKEVNSILWDEVGVDLNAKDWQNLINKVISKVLQTFRRQNLVVWLTVPYLSFISADARRLVHGIFQTKMIDYKEKMTVIKPLLIQVNENSGKMYQKYLRVQVKGVGIIPVKKIRLPKPSKELIDKYEETKKQFTTNLNQEVLQQIISFEEKNKPKPLTIDPQKNGLTPQQSLILQLYKRLKSSTKVAKILELSDSTILEQLKLIKKKFNLPLTRESMAILRGIQPDTSPSLSDYPLPTVEPLKHYNNTDDNIVIEQTSIPINKKVTPTINKK